MEQETLIYVEENDKNEAKVLSENFTNKSTRNRAYFNVLGAELGLKYLSLENINNSKTYNLHNVKKILEEFDISDIILSNIHIDVRMIFDENYIFIPKSHFEFDILPDIYFVMKISEDYSHAEFLGFCEPKLINKNNQNDKYYFIEKEKLSAPSSLRDYVENFKGDTLQNLSEEDNNNAKLLMVSLLDQNISKEDTKSLFSYLIKSKELRDEFIEFENFETLCYRAERSDEIKDLSSDVETPLDLTLDDVNETGENNEIEATNVVNDITDVNLDTIESEIPEENILTTDDNIEETALESIEDHLEDMVLPQMEESLDTEVTDLSEINTENIMPQETDVNFEGPETLDITNVEEVNPRENILGDNPSETVNFESIEQANINTQVSEDEETEDNSLNIEDIQIPTTEASEETEINYQSNNEDILEFNSNFVEDKLDEIPNFGDDIIEVESNEYEQHQYKNEEIDSDLAEIKKEIDREVENDSYDNEENNFEIENESPIQNTEMSVEDFQNSEISNKEKLSTIITDENDQNYYDENSENYTGITNNTFGENYLDEVEHAYNQDYTQENSTNYTNSTLQSDKSEIETLFKENSEIDFEKSENNSKQLNSPMLNNYQTNKLNIKLITAGVIAVMIIGGIGFGLATKYKNSSSASDVLSQNPPEVPISQPESDNTSLLETSSEVDTISANQATLPENSSIQQKKTTEQSVSKNSKPINQSGSYLTVQKISWSTPEYLSYSPKIKDYLQTAGKSIKLSLSSDLLLVSEYAYSNTIKVSMTLSNDGNLKDIKLTKSSGSKQIDELVLQTVKDTLNVIKPATGEVPTPQFNLGLTINF